MFIGNHNLARFVSRFMFIIYFLFFIFVCCLLKCFFYSIYFQELLIKFIQIDIFSVLWIIGILNDDMSADVLTIYEGHQEYSIFVVMTLEGGEDDTLILYILY